MEWWAGFLLVTLMVLRFLYLLYLKA